MQLAEKIRELRKKAGLTQEQLAEKSGLPIGSIQGYEQGYREPYWSVIYRLADALNADCRVFKECVGEDAAGDEKPAKKRGKAK